MVEVYASIQSRYRGVAEYNRLRLEGAGAAGLGALATLSTIVYLNKSSNPRAWVAATGIAAAAQLTAVAGDKFEQAGSF